MLSKKKTLNQEGHKPPVTPHVKNKEEASEYTKLLTKRMKETKEKHQEQIAKGCRLSPLRAPTSKSESNQK